MNAPSRGGPLVILYSKDLDATLNKVREAGGRIAKEPFEFPGGRRFHFEDPSGNELAVWAEKERLSLRREPPNDRLSRAAASG